LVVLVAVALYRYSIMEPYEDKPQYVVCFMCVCPNEIVMKFAKKVAEKYRVYIICDDIHCYTPEGTNITFIKISDEECTRVNWTKSNLAISKVPSAWDKVLYYFAVKETSASHVWFIEEDVFIPRPEMISEIDAQYPNADLVAKQNVSQEEDPGFGWWFDCEGMLEEPMYRSMVCACRLSRSLLNKIVDFVNEHKRLVFIEILFNTLVVKNRMQLAMPEQMVNIVWRHDWTPETVDNLHMFHPIKDVRLQDSYRDRLAQLSDRKN
jgi:hypothetical protein